MSLTSKDQRHQSHLPANLSHRKPHSASPPGPRRPRDAVCRLRSRPLCTGISAAAHFAWRRRRPAPASRPPQPFHSSPNEHPPRPRASRWRPTNVFLPSLPAPRDAAVCPCVPTPSLGSALSHPSSTTTELFSPSPHVSAVPPRQSCRSVPPRIPPDLCNLSSQSYPWLCIHRRVPLRMLQVQISSLVLLCPATLRLGCMPHRLMHPSMYICCLPTRHSHAETTRIAPKPVSPPHPEPLAALNG
jgi:hypothetical protein